jgi:hypothetical protein
MSKKSKKVTVSTASKAAVASKVNSNFELTFNKENFKWLAIGVGLIIVGMLLMLGGYNENPNVWDESQIYGFQRTVLAPFVILSGLAVNIYALFK